MAFVPTQAAPVARDRMARRPQLAAANGVSPSVCIGPVCIGPFVQDGGVSPSVCVGNWCIGPFADSDAV